MITTNAPWGNPATRTNPPRSTRRRLRPAAAVALASAGVAALLAACGGGPAPARVQPAVPVTAGKVVEKTVPVTFRAIGHVEPISTVGVKARIGGELQKVWFKEGQDVRVGDTLFTIDPRQYVAALRQAEAQLAKDQALLKKANSDVQRYAQLVKQDFVTRQDNDQVVATAESLQATVASDQANIDNARLQADYCTIKSPVDGRTGNLVVKAGNLVKADDTTALVTINQMRPIYVSFSVPAQLLPQLAKHNGNRIAVSATAPQLSGPPEEGVLSFVDNAVDTATSTILLKATFANESERLWPGQFVDVVVTLGEEPNRIVAPAPAVQTGQQGQYVFVIKADQTVELRPVTVERMNEVEAIIAKGLAAGETVVTDGQLRLVPGAKVEITHGVGPQEGGGA
jgi:multidrug efflux system membrane fusion protein